MREKSTTADEIAHVTGGYTFNHWNDYRLHPENGLLPQRWEALPSTLNGAHYPSQVDEAWRKSDVWLIGYRFFYRSGNNHEQMLWDARAMNSVFGAATALLVFFWSYRLWGTAGAIVSTIFCVLCPTMLAHSGLATSDMCMTFFLLLAVMAYWHHLNDGGGVPWLISTIVFGLAAVAKHTSLLLLPMVGVMILVKLGQRAPLFVGRHAFPTLLGKLSVAALSLLTHAITVVLFIWMFFGFRYAAFNPSLPAGEFNFTWDLMLSFGGIKAQVIEFCRVHQLLPEGYLYGLAFVLKHAEARGAFLDGEYSIHGWMSFFPKTFLYKTPLSLLAAIATSTVLVGMKFRTITRIRVAQHLSKVIPLLALFVIYWIFSLASHLNIGHRHILPTYPVLYIFCGALGWAGQNIYAHSQKKGLLAASIIAGLLGWHASVAAGIYPHFLAYFSPVAGGPAEGYKHLVDSSLDWGQDLPGLKKWIDANRRPNEPIYLSYFGTGEPDYYGIKAVRLAMLPNFDQTRPWYWYEPGIYALSATMLQHVYMHRQGLWTQEDEHQYQELRRNDANFRKLKADPAAHPELLDGITLEGWANAWKIYDRLRFARLCYYLRVRPPDDMIGYSILIYRLDQKELDQTLNSSFGQLASEMEQVVNEQHSEFHTP